MIIIDGVAKPNLVEWVVNNAREIERLEKELQAAKTLLGFDIRVIDVQEEWVEPTGTFEYGDTILVGPEGGPYVFHIYTRSDDGPYWLNFGRIGLVGPEGPKGDKGDPGEPGTNTRWYVGSNAPGGPDIKDGDCWLRNTDCNVYIYEDGRWIARANIRGLQGIQGPEGKQGKQGIQGPAGPQGPAGSPSPVVNILGVVDSVNQLPDISEVPENAGYLIQFEGTNRLYIVINGVWTNSGTWGGGSSIYEDNEFIEAFNADTKLSVQNYPTYGVIPIVTNTGTVSGGGGIGYMYLDYSLGVGPSGIGGATVVPTYYASNTTVGESRVKNRHLLTGTPTQSAHAANKKYVDDKIAEKHGDELIKPLFMVAVSDVTQAPTMRIPRGLFGSLDAPTQIILRIVDAYAYSSMLGGYSSLYGMGQDPETISLHNTGQPLDAGTYCGWYLNKVNGLDNMITGTAYIDYVEDDAIGIKFSIDPTFPFSEMYLSYVAPHPSTWYFS